MMAAIGANWHRVAAKIAALQTREVDVDQRNSWAFATRAPLWSTNLTPQVFPFRHTTRQCFVVLKPSNDRSNLKAAVWCVDDWSMAPSRWKFPTRHGWQPRIPSTWSSAGWLIAMRSRDRRSNIATPPNFSKWSSSNRRRLDRWGIFKSQAY